MAAINSHKQSFFPWNLCLNNVSCQTLKKCEMDHGSKESWNIARDQENKTLQILWPDFEIFWLKNAQIHDLTSLNTLASDCLNSSHFPA